MNKKIKEIAHHLEDKFSEISFELVLPEHGDHFMFVPADKVDEVITYLKETWEFCFDYLVNLSGFDAGDYIDVTYHLYSYRHKHKFNIKVKASKEKPEVNSISRLYGTANFQEREVFDLLGVVFKGHPNLKRLLLPEDWVGHPLRKDYVEQEAYDGISTTRGSLL